jgi:NAD(P)-dependent dehydrogenase (short-subunit alcohol dehydrogenase family)
MSDMANEKRRYRRALSAVVHGISDIRRSRKAHLQLDLEARIDGLWCLVTGASSGLGFETAVRLLRRGANLIVASRSSGPELAQRLRERALNGSNSGTPAIHAIRLDLARFDSVDSLVSELKERGVNLDVVVLNAGIVASRSRRTVDQCDEMLQVNYLANHLLATRLIERGVVTPASSSGASRPPRFVVVSSEAHRSSPDVPDSDVFETGEYRASESIQWYGYSKLLLAGFTEELSRRYNTDKETRLTVLTMCPGAMSTGIAREAPHLLRPLVGLVLRLAFPCPQNSARVLVHLAVSSEFNETRSDYFHLSSRKAKDVRALDRELTARIWREAEALLARVPHG